MYCAPEMLEENNQAGLFTDLWALGCIIYEMATGIQMFRGKTKASVYDKI
jgi:serine/threonine protein kinase